jgi:hypothetical protein
VTPPEKGTSPPPLSQPHIQSPSFPALKASRFPVQHSPEFIPSFAIPFALRSASEESFVTMPRRSKSLATMPRSGKKKDGASRARGGRGGLSSQQFSSTGTGTGTSGNGGQASSAAGGIAREYGQHRGRGQGDPAQEHKEEVRRGVERIMACTLRVYPPSLPSSPPS